VLTTENIPNAKIERCIDLAEQILSDPNEKLVIMSTFKAPCTQLAQFLQQYNPLVCTGETPDDLVDQYKEMFQNDNEHRIMICTGQKMGTGHTLNRAHYSIFINTPYTDAVLEQWEDRIHRIGTKEPVFIYHLWALDTFDMRVKELVDMKGAISDYIVDGVTEAHINILRRYIEELR
jgi:SNF2 family DNA or RNA helicase